MDQTYQRFLAVADKKQEVFDEDLIAIVHDEIHPVPDVYRLEYMHIYSGTSPSPRRPSGSVCKEEVREGAAIGDGPVDAVYKAISEVTARGQTRAIRDPCRDQRHGGVWAR